uniref:Uncharacterized protein n=1 Tax=Kalanchoe fedtschenkoi TaxID=63787 RepID=A0A7N0TDA4_KALFE
MISSFTFSRNPSFKNPLPVPHLRLLLRRALLQLLRPISWCIDCWIYSSISRGTSMAATLASTDRGNLTPAE